MKRSIALFCAILFAAALSFAQINNGGSGGGNGSGGTVPGVINPTLSPYNAPQTQSCANLNVSLTNGSNVVGCSVATFTSADVGKVIFASCCGGLGGLNKASSVLVVTQGVIHDVINSTSVHVCTTTGTCTPVNSTANSANGTILYWGFKADTAVAAAIAATYAGPGPCQQFYWTGILMVSKGVGNGPANCIYPIGATQDTNLSIQGAGRANSILLLSPDFDFTTGNGNSCGGGPNNNVCFFGLQGIERKYFGINGGGRSNTGNTAVIILDSLIDDFDFDVGISDLGAQDTAMTCYQMDGSGAYPNFVEVDGCGEVPIVINSGTANTLINGYAADVIGGHGVATTGAGMQVKNGATVNTYGMYFGPGVPFASNGNGNIVTVNSGGTWYSNGDICIAGSGNNCVNNIGGTVHLNNFSNPTDFGLTADRALVSQTVAGAKTYITNSSLFGTINQILVSTGTVFVDNNTTFAGGGTNSGLTPTCTFSTGGGTTPSCALQAGSTNEKGTIIATTGTGSPGTTGTITLTFAGTYAGGSGTTPSCSYAINNSGTAWGNEAGTQISTQSTTAPVVAWFNLASGTLTALATSSPYRIDYLCTSR